MDKIGDPGVSYSERDNAIDRAFTKAMVSAMITHNNSSARIYGEHRRRAALIRFIVSAYSTHNPDVYKDALREYGPLAGQEELAFTARQDAHLIELVQPNWGQW